LGQSRSLIFACAVACAACGPSAPIAPTDHPLDLPPLVALAPAAGLDSLVDARPRELLAHPEILPLVTQVIPESELRTFAARHGGVDPRQLVDLVVASYGTTTLVLAQGDFDPARLERAFSERTTSVTSRTIDRPGGPLSTILRLEGATSDRSDPNDRLAVVFFGRQIAGVELHARAGRVGPLRVSELFALHKLQRAHPALDSPPLDVAAQALGDAPLRVFFPGPFEGESAKGLAGLLQAATAVAIAVRPHVADRSDPNDRPLVDLTIDLFGAWNADADTAGQRFAAALESISRSDLGRLCGLHEPVRGPILKTTPTMLSVYAVIDAARVASGLRAATGSQIEEIMKD
jgi:hypothetical protein